MTEEVEKKEVEQEEGINQDLDLPDYLKTIYHWAYVSPRNVPLLDRPLVVNTILWGNMNKLSKAAVDEVKKGQSVLQVATVYGNQVIEMAEKIGEEGSYDLLDVAPIQVRRWRDKLEFYPQAEIFHADAENPPMDDKYDVVLSFFLLHEVPDSKKTRIINAMLDRVKDGGKAVFVDYHEPVKWHPLKFFMRCINRVLEPFAEAMWNHEISFFTDKADKYDWKKTTYFGGLYQKTVVTKK